MQEGVPRLPRKPAAGVAGAAGAAVLAVGVGAGPHVAIASQSSTMPAHRVTLSIHLPKGKGSKGGVRLTPHAPLDTLRSGMRPTSTRNLILVASVLLTAACGSSNATSSGSTPTPTPTPTASALHVPSVDACKLVTTDEASGAIGSTLTNLGSAGGVQIPGACIYGASGSTSTVFVYAQVYADTSTADAVQPDQIAAAVAAQYAVSNAHPVDGIGDKAIEYNASGPGGPGIAILVFRYNVLVLISVDPLSDSKKIEQLARTAVGRLVTA